MTFQTLNKILRLIPCFYPYIFLIAIFYQTITPLSAQEKPIVSYKYLSYLPKYYHSDTSNYPLVIYLHGGSQKGNDLEKLKIYGLPFLVDQGKEFDFIMVAPQCPEAEYWSTENWFDSLYNSVTADYRIDKSRVYVTGISMGGYGTYIAALDNPDKITAILPLCGGINDNDISRICTIKQIPILTYHGTADDQIALHETERIVDLLTECNGNITFHRLEGEGHGIQYIYETNPEIYDWLLKHRK